jgi:hypothetical protein
MFLRGGKNRVGAAVALAALLTMALAAPAGAVPWGGFGETREITSGFLPRVLAWLGVGPDPTVVSKDSSTIDPNGCPKASGVPASRIGGGRTYDGSRVDPVHRR